MKNPIHPIVKDSHGVTRFKRNKLVDALLEHGQRTGFGLNEIALKFDDSEHADDHQQFAQLIGYSLSGYGELPYVSADAYGVAEAMNKNGHDEKDARIAYLEGELEAIRSALRRLFDVHPDDLGGES